MASTCEVLQTYYTAHSQESTSYFEDCMESFEMHQVLNAFH
jgi:hypothetical protein